MRRAISSIFFIFSISLILVLLSSFSLAQGYWGGPLESLSKQERAVLAMMVFNLRRYDLDQATHKKFWEIADSHGWSEKELQEVFDRLLGMEFVRKRYMMRAVLDAYEKKKDTKSAKLQEYEAKLLKMRILSPEKIKESNEFVYKVAHGEPVVFKDIWGELWAETVFNDKWAENYRVNLAILDKYYKMFLQLFDRNWKGK